MVIVDDSNANIETTNGLTSLEPSLLRLHEALLHYAAVSSRVFYIHESTAWDDFTANIEPYNDLSSLDILSMFLNDVLPQLFLYQVPAAIKTRLTILDIHPLFRRSAHGFGYAPDINKHLNGRFTLKPNVDFCLANDVSQARISHTILLDKTVHHRPFVGNKMQMNPSHIALFSAMLATDKELLTCKLHNLAEIHRRLRKAKTSFENSGNLAPYRRNIDGLLKCLEVFVKLKAKVCETLSYF